MDGLLKRDPEVLHGVILAGIIKQAISAAYSGGAL